MPLNAAKCRQKMRFIGENPGSEKSVPGFFMSLTFRRLRFICPGIIFVRLLDNEARMKQQPEYHLQVQFVRWMTLQYRDVLVFSDTAAHIAKTVIQQGRANKLQTPGEKWPDVFVAQPSGEFAGLYLEFKAQSPFKKDGVTLLKNEHIEAQAKTMERLRAKGYQCEFVWNFEQAQTIVKKYFGL